MQHLQPGTKVIYNGKLRVVEKHKARGYVKLVRKHQNQRAWVHQSRVRLAHCAWDDGRRKWVWLPVGRWPKVPRRRRAGKAKSNGWSIRYDWSAEAAALLGEHPN